MRVSSLSKGSRKIPRHDRSQLIRCDETAVGESLLLSSFHVLSVSIRSSKEETEVPSFFLFCNTVHFLPSFSFSFSICSTSCRSGCCRRGGFCRSGLHLLLSCRSCSRCICSGSCFAGGAQRLLFLLALYAAHSHDLTASDEFRISYEQSIDCHLPRVGLRNPP